MVCMTAGTWVISVSNVGIVSIIIVIVVSIIVRIIVIGSVVVVGIVIIGMCGMVEGSMWDKGQEQERR